MHEKIYKAFHQDISIDDYKELDELKKRQLLELVTVFLRCQNENEVELTEQLTDRAYIIEV